ncbi:hypothetical protein BT96DRAFT_947147 [Gymnopus androsaceus JB14]|uniref:Ubiquitin-like protease family profile domain-containing protein n=1 Tax=Gymnopus androsaceus JB14 TaxID=1447944 RepID=A0A6A4GVE1_9AGAR|nr:hypothetical protein BT96DRAFT_947147 [Gymnopus androsaceus JB14]
MQAKKSLQISLTCWPGTKHSNIVYCNGWVELNLKDFNKEVCIRGDLADWKYDPHAKVPFQPNTYDCGIHMLWHLKHIIELGVVDGSLHATHNLQFTNDMSELLDEGYIQLLCNFLMVHGISFAALWNILMTLSNTELVVLLASDVVDQTVQ